MRTGSAVRTGIMACGLEDEIGAAERGDASQQHFEIRPRIAIDIGSHDDSVCCRYIPDGIGPRRGASEQEPLISCRCKVCVDVGKINAIHSGNEIFDDVTSILSSTEAGPGPALTMNSLPRSFV